MPQGEILTRLNATRGTPVTRGPVVTLVLHLRCQSPHFGGKVFPTRSVSEDEPLSGDAPRGYGGVDWPRLRFALGRR